MGLPPKRKNNTYLLDSTTDFSGLQEEFIKKNARMIQAFLIK